MASMTEFNPAEAIAVRSTPAARDTLLRGLADSWGARQRRRERSDWMPRARIMLENGEARPFDPFDR
jgi:hypothetical protein